MSGCVRSVFMSGRVRVAFVSGQLGSGRIQAVFMSEQCLSPDAYLHTCRDGGYVQAGFVSGREFVTGHVRVVFVSGCGSPYVSGEWLCPGRVCL